MDVISDKLKWPQTNPNVFTLIELLLAECTNKHELYKRSASNMRPCDYDLHSISSSTNTTLPITLFNISHNSHLAGWHPWFVKHRLCAKFDITPVSQRLVFLAQFVSAWFAVRRSSPSSSSYVSAATISRYLTLDELFMLVRVHLTYLLGNGLVNTHFSLEEWVRDVFEAEAGQKFINLFAVAIRSTSNARSANRPDSLKLLARNAVRRECRSLSNTHIKQLGLPLHLTRYLR